MSVLGLEAHRVNMRGTKHDAPFKDWFAHCQKMTDLRDGFGMSIPATMTKLVGTKAERRNGSGTGSPVSRISRVSEASVLRRLSLSSQDGSTSPPGCIDESTTAGKS